MRELSILVALASFFLATRNPRCGELPRFERTLPQAIAEAHQSSGALKAATWLAKAAWHQADAAGAALFPGLSLQGSYFYQTEVPSLQVAPLGTLAFGTNNNYSVGPVLSYTLFDGGRDRKNAESYDLLASARDASQAAQRRLLELNVRQAYSRAQYALQQLVLTSDSLKLSEAQGHDIDLRFQAGAASKLDRLQARRDVTAYLLRFEQAQNELGVALRELFALIGERRPLDASRPVPAELAAAPPSRVAAPTLVIQLDPLESALKSYGTRSFEPAGSAHPEIQALERQAVSARLASESEKAGLWPRAQLSAKAAYEYPNVVIPEHAWQNTFVAAISLPLFEGGASRSRSAQRMSESMSAEYQKEQRLTDLSRDFLDANDRLASLKRQRDVNQENVAQAREVARLTYESYRSGRAHFLDVQDANLRFLESRVTTARIDSEIMGEIARLLYLSAP